MRFLSRVVILLTSMVVTLALTSADPDPKAATSTGSFWQSLQVTGFEVEQYASLEEMAAAADAVVKGKFVDIKLSRTIRTPTGDEDAVNMALAVLRVTQTIRGSTQVGDVPLEFVLPSSSSPLDEQIAALRGSMPRNELVVFLRDKGGKEAGLYRTVNSLGLWSETNGKVSAPLSADGAHESLAARAVADETATVGSVDGLASLIAEKAHGNP